MNLPIYLFKVIVKNDRGVWRRLALRSDQSLRVLHSCINESFSYGDVSGYCFKIPPEGRSGTARKWFATYYTDPAIFDQFHDVVNPPLDAESAVIGSLELKPRMKFEYATGYGVPDNWRDHLVSVEENQAGNLWNRYPVIIEIEGVPEPMAN